MTTISFSAEAGALRPSPIRRFASLINDPTVISFAGGVPNPATFPAEALAQAASRAIRDRRDDALQYGPTAGFPALRERIAARLAAGGLPAETGDVHLTTGSQQALDLLARILVDPGDGVVVESPAYVGALACFRARRARFLAATRDDSRLDVASLRERVRALRAAGGAVRVLYTIPNFQNPSGWTLSAPAREELLACAAELDLFVVEDDPYGEVHFGPPPPSPLAALDPGRVAYLGSFSKTLSAGLRTGFIRAPREILAKMELAKQAADLCSSSLDQWTLALYFEENDYDAHLSGVRAFYAEQRTALLDAIAAEWPAEVAVSRPDGGLFCWARMPGGRDAAALLARALERRVAFIPGDAFFADSDEPPRHFLRLTFAKESPERMREGARRLGELLREDA
ncbi:MAG TPA: PLP-dependent aminotransferase family protein [Thermoanaerobaculia bacterium]|nr:PLP-dependent aminotransferase family protein [Thermoanaerobaculia bacterium]